MKSFENMLFRKDYSFETNMSRLNQLFVIIDQFDRPYRPTNKNDIKNYITGVLYNDSVERTTKVKKSFFKSEEKSVYSILDGFFEKTPHLIVPSFKKEEWLPPHVFKVSNIKDFLDLENVRIDINYIDEAYKNYEYMYANMSLMNRLIDAIHELLKESTFRFDNVIFKKHPLENIKDCKYKMLMFSSLSNNEDFKKRCNMLMTSTELYFSENGYLNESLVQFNTIKHIIHKNTQTSYIPINVNNIFRNQIKDIHFKLFK